MLWYLHLCANANTIVTSYVDEPLGTLLEQADGSGKFISIVLKPRVQISCGDKAYAKELHLKAHEMCFIANSLNFPVHIDTLVLT